MDVFMSLLFLLDICRDSFGMAQMYDCHTQEGQEKGNGIVLALNEIVLRANR